MKSVTLFYENSSDIQLIIAMAERLGVKISFDKKLETQTIDNTELFLPLKKISQVGKLKRTIPNPQNWQREIRQDRKLPNRD